MHSDLNHTYAAVRKGVKSSIEQVGFLITEAAFNGANRGGRAAEDARDGVEALQGRPNTRRDEHHRTTDSSLSSLSYKTLERRETLCAAVA